VDRGKRPRVLELVVSTELGGGPAHVAALMQAWPRDAFEITVAGPGQGPFAPVFRRAGAEFVDVPLDRFAGSNLLQLTRLIRERDIDLVHTHGKGAGLFGRAAARLVGVPAVHTFHGLHDRAYPPGLRQLYVWMERALIGPRGHVVHVSPSQARDAARLGLYPRWRSRLIPNGLDTQRVEAAVRAQPVTRSQLGIPEGVPLIGTLARLDRVKAIDVLIRAFKTCLAELPDARLLLVGEGPERARLERQARTLGLGERVRFTGAIPDGFRCLPILDVYTSASRREGLPMSVLEAMCLERPIVASDVGGHRDALQHGRTGVLIQVGDSAALADAWVRMIRYREMAERLGRRARADVLERFSATRMADQVAALYNLILGVER